MTPHERDHVRILGPSNCSHKLSSTSSAAQARSTLPACPSGGCRSSVRAAQLPWIEYPDIIIPHLHSKCCWSETRYDHFSRPLALSLFPTRTSAEA